MKNVCFFLLFTSFRLLSIAQEKNVVADSSEYIYGTELIGRPDYVEPKYVGGSKAEMKFMLRTLRYPGHARRSGTQRKVFVGIVVNKDGSISDVAVLKNFVNDDLDDEAVRIVSLMPKWEPATLGGKAISVKYEVPVSFRLSP